MNRYDDLFPRFVQTPFMYHAEIRENALSVSDDITVLIPEIDAKILQGPCKFMPRVDDLGDTVLPTVGDPALVAFSDLTQPFIVWWERAA